MGWIETVTLYAMHALEIAGVFVIVTGALVTIVAAAARHLAHQKRKENYHRMRRQLGSAILLGLEFLVAADIIRTVAIELTFSSVGVLAALILIRTFLSFTLEVEMTGRWPWQGNRDTAGLM